MITGGELIPIRTGIQEYRHRINLRCDPMTIVMIVSISNYVFLYYLIIFRLLVFSFYIFVYFFFSFSSNNLSIYKIFEIKVKFCILSVHIKFFYRSELYTNMYKYYMKACCIYINIYIWKYRLDWCDYTMYISLA